MAIGLRSTGGGSSVTASATLCPVGFGATEAQNGDRCILGVASKGTAGSGPSAVTFTDPTTGGTGWVKIGEFVTGSDVTVDPDVGSAKIGFWYHDCDGTHAHASTSQNVSISGANCSAGGIIIYSKAAGETWETPTTSSYTTGVDTTTASNYSATGGALDIASGDWFVVTGFNEDSTGTIASHTLTYTGCTLTVNPRKNTATTTGANQRFTMIDATCTAGSASSGPVHSFVLSTADRGGSMFLRLRVTAGTTVNATVAMTATSTLTTAAFEEQFAAVPMTATSTLTVTATVTTVQAAAVALSATSTLTVNAVRDQPATVAMSATSTLTATAVRAPQAAVSMTTTSTLTVTAVRSAVATVALSAVSTLTTVATQIGTQAAAVALTAASTLTVVAVKESFVSAALTATSTLTATAVRTALPTVALSTTSTLTAVAVRTAGGSVPMATVSTLTVVATQTGLQQATANLVAASTLTVVGERIRLATVTMTATSTLVTTGVPQRVASVALVTASTLTVTAVIARPSAATLVTASTLTVLGVRVSTATVSMTAVSTLEVTASVFVAAMIRNAALTGYLYAKDTDGTWHPVQAAKAGP